MRHLAGAVIFLAVATCTTTAFADTGLFFGASAGGYATVNGDLQPSFIAGVEAGCRLPWLDRAFGLSIAPSFSLVRLGTGMTKSAFVLTVPILFSINFVLGPGLFRSGGGAFVAYSQIESESGTAVSQDRALGIGPEAMVAYLWRIKKFAVGLSLDYRRIPFVVAEETLIADQVSAGISGVINL